MLQNGQVYDQRSPKWWDRWVNPTTALALIGGIVWGVQLNMLTVSTAEKTAGLEALHAQIQLELRDMRINQEKQTIILDSLLRQVTTMDTDMESHIREAESWKQRIIQNERMIPGIP